MPLCSASRREEEDWLHSSRSGRKIDRKEIPLSGRFTGHLANITALHTDIRQTAIRQAAEFINGDPVIAPRPKGAEEVHVRFHTVRRIDHSL